MHRFALILALLPGAGFADGHSALFGVWGTEAQCAGALLIPGGTVHAAPVEITEGWLIHGDIWCALTWFPAQTRANGAFVSTQAVCGEDSQRSYRLDMDLDGNDLTLIWDEALVNGPMGTCPR